MGAACGSGVRAEPPAPEQWGTTINALGGRVSVAADQLPGAAASNASPGEVDSIVAIWIL
jgi:hypothetical protein